MRGIRLKTVLVGAGRVGAGYADDPRMSQHHRFATHAQVLAEHPKYDWVAVVDSAADRAEKVAARWGIPLATTDIGRVARIYSPDVAVLAMPFDGRSAVLAALPTLRAVLVEKPLGETLGAAQSFLDRWNHLLIQVNLWRRADHTFRTLAAAGIRDHLGSLQALTCVYGNGLRNNATHMVDFVRMLFDDFACVQALPSPGTTGNADSADPSVFFAARLRGGATIAFHPLDFEHYREVALDAWGTRGRLTITVEGLVIQTFARKPSRATSGEFEVASDSPVTFPSTVGLAFFHMYSNLAEAIGEGATLWSPGTSALETTKVISAVCDSVAAGGSLIDLHL